MLKLLTFDLSEKKQYLRYGRELFQAFRQRRGVIAELIRMILLSMCSNRMGRSQSILIDMS